jgi:hypothetical protein
VKNPFRGARYANVTATLALVVALGGTSYAVGTIGTQDLKPNAVTSPKIKNGQVKAPDLKVGAVRSPQVKDDALTGADVLESSLGEVPSAADVPDITWANLTLINNWTVWDTDRGAQYGMDAEGVVYFRGGIDNPGVFSSVFAVLPPAYRPVGGFAYVSTNFFGGTGPARIIINPNGNVSVDATSPATDANAADFTSLDGVSFAP